MGRLPEEINILSACKCNFFLMGVQKECRYVKTDGTINQL
jgi:hypothetical protein